MIANIVIKSVFVIGVTLLAIKFNNIHIAWWFLMLPFLGYEVKQHDNDKKTE